MPRKEASTTAMQMVTAWWQITWTRRVRVRTCPISGNWCKTKACQITWLEMASSSNPRKEYQLVQISKGLLERTTSWLLDTNTRHQSKSLNTVLPRFASHKIQMNIATILSIPSTYFRINTMNSLDLFWKIKSWSLRAQTQIPAQYTNSIITMRRALPRH